MQSPSRRLVSVCMHWAMAISFASTPVSIVVAQTPSVAAADKDVESVSAKKPNAVGNKWAILIGVNKYQNPNIAKLKFCTQDGLSLANALIANAGYEAERVWFLGNGPEDFDGRRSLIAQDRRGEAEREQIQGTLNKVLPQIGLNDTLFVAFSGHGALVKHANGNGHSYLIPSNGDPDKLETTAITVDWLLDQLSAHCKATRKLVLLDACHSGGALEIEGLHDKTPENVAGTDDNDTGMVIYVSCRSDQVSQENPRNFMRQGLFCHFMCRALIGDREADADRDGTITAAEAYKFSRDGVRGFVRTERLSAQDPGWKVIGSAGFAIAPARAYSLTESNFILETLPGLSGGWWFDETPFLAPRLRMFMTMSDVQQLAIDRVDAKSQLRTAATAALKDATALPKLSPLLRLRNMNPTDAHAEIQRLIVELEKPPTTDSEATDPHLDQHLLAVLRFKIAKYEEAAKAFENALSGYQMPGLQQDGLHALCLADYATFLASRGDPSRAIDYFTLAESQIGERFAPAFRIYCLCNKADACRKTTNWDDARDALESAQQIAVSQLPVDHPLRAFVYERKAWFNMDRWNVTEANECFHVALQLRKSSNERGDHVAMPFIFQDRHGELASDRYLKRRGTDELVSKYKELVNDISAEVRSLSTRTTGPISSENMFRQKDMKLRISNTCERMADLQLYSCKCSDLLTSHVALPAGKASPLSEAYTYICQAEKTISSGHAQIEKELLDDLPRILYKKAIIESFVRHEEVTPTETLQKADAAQKEVFAQSSSNSTPSQTELLLQSELYPSLAHSIVKWSRTFPVADRHLFDSASFETNRNDVRKVLNAQIDRLSPGLRKRDDVEMLLFASSLLVAAHAIKDDKDFRIRDAEQLSTVVDCMNTSTPQLRRYLYPYYCMAIQSLISSNETESYSVLWDLIMKCKYGSDRHIELFRPVVIFHVDKPTVHALALDGSTYTLFSDCLAATSKPFAFKPTFDKLARTKFESEGKAQFLWNDPDLEIDATFFPKIKAAFEFEILETNE